MTTVEPQRGQTVAADDCNSLQSLAKCVSTSWHRACDVTRQRRWNDAKFPREQVLALFESNVESEITEARHEFERVMKAQAKRIRTYIQPENGTTDIALMYLPSETLYMEAVRNRELADWLNAQHVFPVSPNTLLMTLQTIALVHKWYEVASRFEKTRSELGKAMKSFEHFQNNFENVGKNLNKAQEAFETAQRHLKSYRGKVTALSGQEQ